MKKLFVSCPMKGKKEEEIRKNIEKLHKAAEAITGENLELIPSYAPDQDFKDRPIACLGNALVKMQDADYFICPVEAVNQNNRGCLAEHFVATAYGIKVLGVQGM